MRVEDVSAVLDIQEPGAVAGLGEVFPQDSHPFPRRDIRERWLQEIAAADIDCYVVLEDEAPVGFAAVRGAEILHLGVALDRWGSGTAQAADDAVISLLRSRGVRRAWLLVFTDNRRGLRFYQRLGWRPTGERARSAFPPYPELLRYERALDDS
ncbi:GNAT family N-acetyltransferase [Nostocoides sp. F2B08]|nr:GNAT family N-acetyltransferase [Tetrasphaera sp. F2B08]